MFDFEISELNGGEIAIEALNERAQKSRRLNPGTRIVFKSSGDAREYVEVVEGEGFTFLGRNLVMS
ncbi:MAG: hypothetical protein ACRED9_01025 [Caulobacteraceae bacterium]